MANSAVTCLLCLSKAIAFTRVRELSLMTFCHLLIDTCCAPTATGKRRDCDCLSRAPSVCRRGRPYRTTVCPPSARLFSVIYGGVGGWQQADRIRQPSQTSAAADGEDDHALVQYTTAVTGRRGARIRVLQRCPSLRTADWRRGDLSRDAIGTASRSIPTATNL
jgi:hypothetical protein